MKDTTSEWKSTFAPSERYVRPAFMHAVDTPHQRHASISISDLSLPSHLQFENRCSFWVAELGGVPQYAIKTTLHLRGLDAHLVAANESASASVDQEWEVDDGN